MIKPSANDLVEIGTFIAKDSPVNYINGTISKKLESIIGKGKAKLLEFAIMRLLRHLYELLP